MTYSKHKQKKGIPKTAKLPRSSKKTGTPSTKAPVAPKNQAIPGAPREVPVLEEQKSKTKRTPTSSGKEPTPQAEPGRDCTAGADRRERSEGKGNGPCYTIHPSFPINVSPVGSFFENAHDFVVSNSTLVVQNLESGKTGPSTPSQVTHG